MIEFEQDDVDLAFENSGIHTARKAGQCHFWRGGERCKHIIQPGEKYIDGPFNLEAGPWSRDRICAKCAAWVIEHEKAMHS